MAGAEAGRPRPGGDDRRTRAGDPLDRLADGFERIAASGAPIVAAGPGAASLGARHAIELPPAPDPLLSPLLSVLPGQLFAAALARAKRLDAGAPRNLRKVTLAR